MDIDKLFDTIALPAESPLEKILQTEISPLEVPKADLIPWDVNELTQKCGLASHEMAKKLPYLPAFWLKNLTQVI